MIKKITQIKDFGIFKNFDWSNNIKPFNKYNYFFGWNYSGKSTLSRIFKCIANKEINNDFNNAEFALECEGEISITNKNLNQSDIIVRVFNEDFIEENFEWNNENKEIEPVLILGEENIELNKKLEELKSIITKKEKEKNEKEKEKNGKEKNKDEKLTNKASEIRNILGITNQKEFDKSVLQKSIINAKDYKILNNEELKKQKSKYNSKNLEKINKINYEFKVNTYKEEIEKLLSKKVKPTEIIKDFISNTELSEWVHKGLGLHRDKDTCQFCGNPLTQERLEKLNQHFSKEYNNFIKELDKLKSDILNYKSNLQNLSFPDKARFYDEFQSDYENKIENIKESINNLTTQLQDLVSEIERKKEKVFDEIHLEKNFDDSIEEKAKNLINEINEIIEKHNATSDNLDEEKKRVKESIIKYYVKDFVENSDYTKIVEEIEKLTEEIKKINDEIKDANEKIKEIEQKIEASSIGAEKINTIFKEFFGDDKLRIEKTENGKYKLYRDETIAKNLSTGERNIISLIYFFIKLEETGFDRSNAIIFIDDPVSSLDSNHMYQVYSFICQKIKDLQQVFITTHNFDFFNLLKDMNRYDLKNNEGNFYLVKRIKNANNDYCTIENLPSVLLKFKSEYNYLFNILMQYNDSQDKSSFELLYILPNIARRFLEAYLFQKYPDGKKFKDKCNKFFGNSESSEIKTTLKLLDEHSHEENPEHSQKFPDIKELETSVKCILESLEQKDKDHFEALCESLKGGN